MIHNYLPDSIWKMDISLSCKVIAERICAMTNKGKKEVEFSNEYIFNLTGISPRAVQRALSSLKDLKIIESKVLLREKRVRLVKFIYQENNNGDL